MKWTKRLKKCMIFVLSLVLVLGVAAGCASTNQATGTGSASAGGKGTVKIGYVNWAECIAVTNLWKVILEDQGYQVELSQLDTAPLFVGLSKGNIDVFMDSWLPITHKVYWEEYQNSLEDYGVWYEGSAKLGIVVPKYVTIDSITQLKDQKDKFNGKIIGIDPGAGIMKSATKANESYNLGFELVQSSESAMLATLETAYNKNEWIAITGWSPHWIFAKYDLKYLEDPQKAFGEAEQLHTLANKNFSEKQPKVAAMLKKFKMTDAQVGTLEGLINDGMEPEAAAKQWMQDNKDIVNSWIS
ncbi:MAG: glycine betaine ABC transporter substrate-binding protein [Oscillospiraceae bacterium]|nr:glycine betaine ABC transporter substrate-binding protein [Oscillospiraceae bacterium]